VKPLLERIVAAEPKWKLTTGKDWRLKWISRTMDDPELLQHLLTPDKIFSRYPDSKSLAVKDGFAQMTNFIQSLDPEQYDIAPLTFTLPCKLEAQRL
jgi:hypothetical protein